MLVRDISCGLKCEICGTATYIGQEDIVIGIKHMKGWSYRLICGRCLGDRKEFMGEYGKAVNNLVRRVRGNANEWWANTEFVNVGIGIYRRRKSDNLKCQQADNEFAAENNNSCTQES